MMNSFAQQPLSSLFKELDFPILIPEPPAIRAHSIFAPPHLDPAEKDAIGLSLDDLKHVHSEGTTASVTASGAFTFYPKVDRNMQDDVQNSMLFAQLAANGAVGAGPDRDIVAWFKQYCKVLRSVGWNVAEFNFQKVENALAYTSPCVLVVDRASTYLPPPELAHFKATINALTSKKNPICAGIFESSSRAASLASFQVGVVDVADCGNPRCNISYFYYKTNKNLNSTLFYKWGDDSVEFQAGHQTMILNKAAYARVRERVMYEIVSNARAVIENLDL